MKAKGDARASAQSRPRASASSSGDDFESRYSIRDMLLFPDMLVGPSESVTIEVMPEVESLVQRIVFHRSIAARFTLSQILVGDVPRTRVGSGSCEVFLADVPNWAPARMVISPEAPLRLRVRNMIADQGFRISGSVIIGVEELPVLPQQPPQQIVRRGLLGGLGGLGGAGSGAGGGHRGGETG